MSLQDLPPWLMNAGGFALLLYFLKKWVTEIDRKLDNLITAAHVIDTWKAVTENRLGRIEGDVNSLHARVSKLISDKIDAMGGK